jgi:hypothetical protein
MYASKPQQHISSAQPDRMFYPGDVCVAQEVFVDVECRDLAYPHDRQEKASPQTQQYALSNLAT